MRQLIASATVLVLAACGGSAASAPADAVPTVGATAPPGTAQAPSTAPTQAPESQTPAAAASSAPTPGQGSSVGPVFAGTLVQAFPRVVAGQAVKVDGPWPAGAMENLDKATLAVIEQLTLDPKKVEVAIGTDSAVSVMITGIRFAGVDSAALDAAYLAVQEGAAGTSNFRVVPTAGRNVHAYDSLIGTLWWWVNGDILFSIFGSEQAAQQAIAAMPLPTVALVAGGDQLPDAEVELAIASGPHAGNYTGSTTTGGCSRNALGNNQFGLAYSNEASADGFTSFQMIVRDAAAAADSGTNDFTATVMFGPMYEATSYQLNEADNEGSGTVSINQGDNDHAVVTVSGETADGVQLDATITCNVVFDMGA